MVEVEEAIGESARVLAGARGAVVVGLGRSTNESVAEAVRLADTIGATIEVGDGSSSWRRIVAFQRGGAVGATLGEVKTRADVVVFWGCDPARTHPRHFERYSIDAVGRFTADGRSGRRVVVVDEEETETARRADDFFPVRRDRELEFLLVLRALVREAALDPIRTASATGHRLDALAGLAETLRGARYGAWFMGPFAGRGGGQGAEARYQAVTSLVRELAKRTRFVALGLGEAGNVHGAEGVLGWQSGFAPGVDFGAGYPESLPGESSAIGRLGRGEFDAALVVGGAAATSALATHWDVLASRPWIYIGPPENPAFGLASVAFPASTPGVDASGTFTRVDGVSIPVRPIRPASFPSEGDWLAALDRAVRDLRTAGVESATAGGP